MPPRLRQPRLQSPSRSIINSSPCQCLFESHSRQFSSTPRNATRQRADMFRWLNGPGKVFRQPLPGSTNYLNAYDRSGNLLRVDNSNAAQSRKSGDEEKKKDEGEDTEIDIETSSIKKKSAQRPSPEARMKGAPLPKETREDLMPFPMNREFRSQSVLSEQLKDAIYRKVIEQGKSVRDVSATLGVEMRRVAAVVRLKAVEKEWDEQGKRLATPYSKAVLSMLPQTPYLENDPMPHESINDLPVHRATLNQIFHPVSESRHFTRSDAAKVFQPDLLPADDRVPHTELVQLEKWRFEGIQQDQRVAMMREKNEKEAQAKRDREARRREIEARETIKVDNGRSIFKFQEVKVDERVGEKGRGREGVGARYGVPHQDRKKGQIKIPTRVE